MATKTPEQQRLSDIRYDLKIKDMSDIQLFNHLFEKGAHYAKVGKLIEVRALANPHVSSRNEWILKTLTDAAKVIPITPNLFDNQRKEYNIMKDKM
jgi:hypothetical protein